jgi:hypothetical protein
MTILHHAQSAARKCLYLYIIPHFIQKIKISHLDPVDFVVKIA